MRLSQLLIWQFFTSSTDSHSDTWYVVTSVIPGPRVSTLTGWASVMVPSNAAKSWLVLEFESHVGRELSNTFAKIKTESTTLLTASAQGRRNQSDASRRGNGVFSRYKTQGKNRNQEKSLHCCDPGLELRLLVRTHYEGWEKRRPKIINGIRKHTRIQLPVSLLRTIVIIYGLIFYYCTYRGIKIPLWSKI